MQRFIPLLLATICVAQVPDLKLISRWEWRNIGPASMGGRIADIAGVPGDPNLVYAAAGSAGLFKSTNAGTTWRPIFDHESTISIGGIAIDEQHPSTIWVGTGEANLRNSVSFGDGVYLSRDGGKSWRNMGLKDTQTISRVVVNPKNADIAYVAAVGHTFGPNAERGVFATFDGGKTWQKTLFIDNVHGAADIDIDPSNPDVLYATMWHFDRKPWTFESGDTNGGVFKSVDAGRTWKKLTNLPKLMGRIGVKVSPSNPKVVYVIAECNEGTLFRSNDAGATFEKLSSERDLVGRGYYFADMRVDPTDENRIYVLTNGLMLSADGGKSFKRIAGKVHGDLHALWIDPKDPRRLWEGNDGGLAVSQDRGDTWEQINNIPLGQFYQVYADNRVPFYNITGGMQDNGSWTGPSRTREPMGIMNDDWHMINGFVGFDALSDPDDPDIVITEQSGGVLLRTDLKTREQQQVGPNVRNNNGGTAAGQKYRFNWDAPFVKSPFGKNTWYLAGNAVFQSSDSGHSWEPISGDLTNNDQSKMQNAGGPVWIENSADLVYSTILSVSESPAKRGVIWTGTDDGDLQRTTDGGTHWTNLSANLPGIPKNAPISHVEASRNSELTAYVSLDLHMFDDFRALIFRTTDGGKTFTKITNGLPANGWVWTVREDPKNPDLLYAGTELGLFASWNAGTTWAPLHLANMPYAIAVRDILIHPDSNDLIVATHGRSVYVLDDISALQHMSGEASLLAPRPAYRHAMRATHFAVGDKAFAAPNPPYGALITYFLPAEGNVRLEILDSKDAAVRNLRDAPHEAGFNRVAWDLHYESSRGPQAVPGAYKIRLTVDGKTLERPLDLRMDPNVTVSAQDLALQFDYARRIEQLQARVNAAIRKIDASGTPNPLRDQLARPRGAERSETGPRLLENLMSLAAMIDSPNAAPTPAMISYFNELNSTVESLLKQL